MAISQYYLKEILFGFIMILAFRLVNESYQNLFMGPLSYVS